MYFHMLWRNLICCNVFVSTWAPSFVAYMHTCIHVYMHTCLHAYILKCARFLQITSLLASHLEVMRSRIFSLTSSWILHEEKPKDKGNYGPCTPQYHNRTNLNPSGSTPSKIEISPSPSCPELLLQRFL